MEHNSSDSNNNKMHPRSSAPQVVLYDGLILPVKPGDDVATCRHKMEALQVATENAHGGRTNISNLAKVCIDSLQRTPELVLKFFQAELGATFTIDAQQRRYVLNGERKRETLQKKLGEFIRRFVLCPKCQDPGTRFFIATKEQLGKKSSSSSKAASSSGIPQLSQLAMKCLACSHVADCSADSRNTKINKVLFEQLITGLAVRRGDTTTAVSSSSLLTPKEFEMMFLVPSSDDDQQKLKLPSSPASSTKNDNINDGDDAGPAQATTADKKKDNNKETTAEEDYDAAAKKAADRAAAEVEALLKADDKTLDDREKKTDADCGEVWIRPVAAAAAATSKTSTKPKENSETNSNVQVVEEANPIDLLARLLQQSDGLAATKAHHLKMAAGMPDDDLVRLAFQATIASGRGADADVRPLDALRQRTPFLLQFADIARNSKKAANRARFISELVRVCKGDDKQVSANAAAADRVPIGILFFLDEGIVTWEQVRDFAHDVLPNTIAKEESKKKATTTKSYHREVSDKCQKLFEWMQIPPPLTN